MKFCKPHWDMCREAIKDRGMDGLVLKSGEAAVDNIEAELRGEKTHFEPLMSMNNHWWSEALRCGGLYLMGQNETGENDGHYCPVCEFEKHSQGFVAKDAIGGIADQMLEHALAEGLIPKPQ